MCCCGKANINGEQGYSWDGKTFSTRKPFFPELEASDELVRDLPGRCGGVDSHSYDFRLVRRYGSLYLLVNHGGGSEAINLRSFCPGAAAVQAMSDNDCYWMMQMLYHVQSDAARKENETVNYEWQKAAIDQRIKTRKRAGQVVKVWIEPQRESVDA